MNITIKQLTALANRYLNLIVTLAIVAVGALAAYQIYNDLTYKPNQAYIDQQSQAAANGVIRINTQVINAVKNLSNVPGQPDLSNLGKSDPFSP